MNKRIQELSSQVGAVRNVLAMGRSDGVLFTEYELEKFAELIVRECVEYYRSQIGETSEPHTKTLEHFGVEE